MSSVVSPVAGGVAPAHMQSGTAVAVTDPCLTPPSSRHDPEIKNVISPIPTTSPSTCQGIGAEDVDNDSDFDSVFGDVSELKGITNAPNNDSNDENILIKESPHNHGGIVANKVKTALLGVPTTNASHAAGHSYWELSGSGRRSGLVKTPSQLTFPKIAQPRFNKVNHNSDNSTGTTVYEESHDNGSASDTATNANHQTTAAHEAAPNARLIMATGMSTPSPKQTPVSTPQHVTPTSAFKDPSLSTPDNGSNIPSPITLPNANSPSVFASCAMPASASSGDFTGSAAGSVPEADFGNSTIFGPELQQTLFADGEVLANPKPPGSGSNNQVRTPLQAVTIQPVSPYVEEDITITSPSSPPRPSPLIFNIPIFGPPASPPNRHGSKHNPMPSKPETPLADQLRSAFWDNYGKELQLLASYTQTYKAWQSFVATPSNQSSPDYASTAAELKACAAREQAAWTKHARFFEHWKATNPAVEPIVANAHDDTRAFEAASKASAERAEFVRALRGKPEMMQKAEFAQYNQFMALMKQSRQREMWRGRSEALVKAEGIIESQQRAVVEEQERIAAEEETKKADTEAEEQRKGAEGEAKAKLGEARKKDKADAEELNAVEQQMLALLAREQTQADAQPTVETQQDINTPVVFPGAVTSQSAASAAVPTQAVGNDAVAADTTVANNVQDFQF
ncbi:hypothetical protein VTI74DRAFT_6611 [Chaetomium olivicolor]